MSNQWLDLTRIINTQKMATSTMEDAYERHIITRQCSEPIKEVKAIYATLNYQPKPFTKKKSVVPPTELKIYKRRQNQTFYPT